MNPIYAEVECSELMFREGMVAGIKAIVNLGIHLVGKKKKNGTGWVERGISLRLSFS